MDVQSSLLDKKTQDFLNSVKIASIKINEAELITLKPDDTVETSLKKLAMHAISSAPVFDGNFQKIMGSISILDLAVWVVRTFAIAKGDKTYDYAKLDDSFNTTVRQLTQTGFEPFWPINENESLATLISSYFKWRIHRAPVTADKKIVGHISQSDAVAFLAQNRKYIDSMANKTLKDLSLESGPVLSILKGKPLIDAFTNIVETRFSGLAIIDEQGKLVNNISASDLKGVTKDTFWKLELPIEQILGERQKLPPLTCKPQDTLGDVIQKLVDCRVHRIYVVDSSNHPTNVITLTTILKVFAPKGSECFA